YATIAGRGEPVIDIARGIRDDEIAVTGGGQGNVRRRAVRFLEELGAMPATLEEQIRYLFDPELTEDVPDASEEKKQWIRRDLEELRDASLAIVEEEGDAALATLIGKLRYRIATRAPLSSEPPARVKIMTLHSAKG